MQIDNSNHTVQKLEKEYLSQIEKQSLADLAITYEMPLDNITDMFDLINTVSDDGIKFLLHNEEFLNLPILAHCCHGEEEEKVETFLIEHYSDDDYRAIEIKYGICSLSFCAKIPEWEVNNSKYKTVRDILPLIDSEFKI